MSRIQVYQSAVDGKFYKAAGDLNSIESSCRFEAAGIVMPSDVSSVQAVTILNEVLGLARPQYTLRGICRPIPMDNLTMRVDIATSLAGQRKVKPLEEAKISAEAYSAVNFDLWKNVVHVAMPDETQMKSAHPLLQMHVSDAARDLARMGNLDIAEEVEGKVTEKVSSVPYVDWGAVSSGLSVTNPLTAITASINYIQGKGYPVDFMAMHPTVYGKFLQNTFISKMQYSGLANLGTDGGTFRMPGYPTIKIFTDFALTETPTSSVGPIVGSSAAPGIALGQGPTMAASYRNELAGYDGYIIREWSQPKVVLDDALDIICT
jgi:hypothetical protein